jgi:hypothetical protein
MFYHKPLSKHSPRIYDIQREVSEAVKAFKADLERGLSDRARIINATHKRSKDNYIEARKRLLRYHDRRDGAISKISSVLKKRAKRRSEYKIQDAHKKHRKTSKAWNRKFSRSGGTYEIYGGDHQPNLIIPKRKRDDDDEGDRYGYENEQALMDYMDVNNL